MGLMEAIVYGIIQGLTEFLPISSTAHLRIFPALVGWQDPGAAFTAVIQLGTLLAVLIYFRTDLWGALKGWVAWFSSSDKKATVEAKMGWAIVIGTIPVVVAGILLKKKIEGDFRSLYVIAGSLIGMGILLFIADRIAAKQRKIESVTAKDGLIVGLWQMIALIPGSSRSGSTITGALFDGFDRAAAARFSFLLSVPSILAAGLKELWDERHALGHDMAPVILSTAVSFIVGYWSIGFLIRYLQKHTLTLFVAYRIALGIILLILLRMGTIEPMQGVVQPQSSQAVAMFHTR